MYSSTQKKNVYYVSQWIQLTFQGLQIEEYNAKNNLRKEIFKEIIVISKLFDCLGTSFRRCKEDLFFARNYFRG